MFSKANGYDLDHMTQRELIQLVKDFGMKQADNGLWFKTIMKFDGEYLVFDKNKQSVCMDKYELKEFLG